MPSKPKAKTAPSHQHDKRHDTGLAAPGKRVSRHLTSNGLPNGRPSHSASLSPLPAAGLDLPACACPAPDCDDAPTAGDHAGIAERRERDRTCSEASTDPLALPQGDMAADEPAHHDSSSSSTTTVPPLLSGERRAAVRMSSSPPNQPAAALAAVSTILTSYPLRDAISILILLLSLPPTFVLVIQTLFASLTFVPPTAGISLPSVKDMFNASSLGYPALATILLVDLIFYLCWLPVWKPVQGILLDLSQAVIAVSLSGAAAHTGGPTYSIVTCSAVVCAVHVLRYRAVHLTALDYLRSVIHRYQLGIDLNVVSSAASSSFLFAPPSRHGWLYTAVRTILGIHIVSQGVTTCIRRSLASANEKTNAVPAITKTDSEAPTSHDTSARASPAPPDPAQQPSCAVQSADARPPGPSPAHRDGKARESNSKKKRKQANQVRSQQPLWAAIASTKVTFVKEMEQRDAADDAREAACMDKSTNTVTAFANSDIPTSDRVWMSEVRDTEMFFSVELSPETVAVNENAPHDDASRASAGIDKSKPFYIRVNGASWSSTRILPSPAGDEDMGNRFDGEIFGLAPLSSYHCEVVAIANHRVLCSASLITLSAPTAEQAPTAPIVQQHQALRPSSPTTTLKQSIQQAEARLAETRNRSKKSKKDQRAAHSDVKREINALRGKLDSSGGMDDKQARRLQQISQHKNQAEEATVQLTQQIHALGETPADDVAKSEANKRDWQSALAARSAASDGLEAARAEGDRELKYLKADIAAAESRRDKLTSRHQQRNDELESVVSRQRAEMSARQKHDYERAVRREERGTAEAQLRYHVGTMASEADMLNAKAVEAYQQGQALQTWPSQPSSLGLHGYSSPPSPKASLPGTNGSFGPHMHTNGYTAFGAPPLSAPHATFHHPQQQQQHQLAQAHPPRGRSSSMLSQYSGFTDNGDEYVFEARPHSTWPSAVAAPHNNGMTNAFAGAGPEQLLQYQQYQQQHQQQQQQQQDRKVSEGGSSLSTGTSGSTASSSPRPDGRYPMAAKIAPIGPPRKKTASPQQQQHQQGGGGIGFMPPGVVGSGR